MSRPAITSGLATMYASTPRPRPRRDHDAELADAIERAFVTRFGKVPVVAEQVLTDIRRRGGAR